VAAKALCTAAVFDVLMESTGLVRIELRDDAVGVQPSVFFSAAGGSAQSLLFSEKQEYTAGGYQGH
jgi:hypothetical protein